MFTSPTGLTLLDGHESVWPALPGPNCLKLRFFSRPRPGLDIAGTSVKDHFPEPRRFIAVPALSGLDGEVARVTWP